MSPIVKKLKVRVLKASRSFGAMSSMMLIYEFPQMSIENLTSLQIALAGENVCPVILKSLNQTVQIKLTGKAI